MFTLTRKTRCRLIRAGRVAIPLILSACASAFVAWGSVQYAKGSDAQRLSTVERDVRDVKDDVTKARGEHEQFVRRDSFQIVLDDLKEIKSDVRAVRYGTPQTGK